MPGDGTRTAITKSKSPPPPARVLDLTRLMRRAGRVLTGVDRVEYAYARALSRQDIPCFGLVRSAFGVMLIKPEMLWPVVRRVCHGKCGAPDFLSRLGRRRPQAEREAETEFRRAALARGRAGRLRHLLAAHLPSGFSYVNVGHSHLEPRVFQSVRKAGGRSSVMVHDVIPMEHPSFQRSGTVQRFRAKMQAVQSGADLILYNSRDTQVRAERVLGDWGVVPKGHVALLGVHPPSEIFADRGERPNTDGAYFVALGTLEPRKNVGFLLDLWDDMGPGAPTLFLCGARGWKCEDVFARLDALPPGHPVREVPDLNDAARDQLLCSARALLCPSHAEGFGLPAVEAAQLGVPVICNTLEVYQETLGDIPIYASVKDPYLWKHEIRKLTETVQQNTPRIDMDRLSWEAHFKTVLSLI